ncbi:dihydrofolate reductase family protein [Streptomyces triculaminicus]|uniref:dihydrofolate reductase family protein n=1 Tax=Streptomyces triculaminicus TaxID=2816232 RepID=UPI0033CBF671
MRKLVYFIAATLDGHIAAPDGGDPTGPDGFWTIGPDYLEQVVTEYPETLPGPARTALSITAEGTHFDTVLEGRHTYEIGVKAGIDDAYPHLKHVVFSRSLTSVPGTAVELVGTDPVEKVRELKQEDGKDIWLCGGGELAGLLQPEIDRLIVKLSPITTGAGIPLLGRKTGFDVRQWELTAHTVLPSGVLFLTYDRPSAA